MTVNEVFPQLRESKPVTHILYFEIQSFIQVVTLNITSDGKSVASAEYKRFEISVVTVCDFHYLESKLLQNYKKSYSEVS